MSKNEKKPNKEKRTFLYAATKPLVWWLVYPFFGLRVIKGKNNLPKTGGCIAAGNHIHFADPVIIAFSQRRQIRWMAKAELFDNGVTRVLCKGYDAFPVLRGSADGEALNTSLRTLEDGRVLGIFPEGTRSRDGKIGRGKSGTVMLAFKSKLPIYPFAIYSKRKPLSLFCGYTVAFGEPVTAEQLGVIEGTSREIREGTRRLMEIITGLHEECRAARA